LDTNFVFDSKGNKLGIQSYCTYCMVIITYVLPETRPIDVVCFMPDGYIFGQLRDSEYRGSEPLDNHREVVQADLFERGFLPPGVDSVYCHVHPDNKRSINWLLPKGWVRQGSVEKDGQLVDKYVLSSKVMLSNANKIKERVS